MLSYCITDYYLILFQFSQFIICQGKFSLFLKHQLLQSCDKKLTNCCHCAMDIVNLVALPKEIPSLYTFMASRYICTPVWHWSGIRYPVKKPWTNELSVIIWKHFKKICTIKIVQTASVAPCCSHYNIVRKLLCDNAFNNIYLIFLKWSLINFKDANRVSKIGHLFEPSFISHGNCVYNTNSCKAKSQWMKSAYVIPT